MSRRSRREGSTLSVGERIVFPEAEVERPTTIEHAEPPFPAIALGRLKDGRHVAMELRVQGSKVVGATAVCASQYVEPVAKAWEAAAYVRLYARQKFNSVEAAAHAQEARGVVLEHLESASCLGLPLSGGKRCVVAFQVEGATVSDPEVVAIGNLNYCWGRLEDYAARNLLPRRKKP